MPTFRPEKLSDCVGQSRIRERLDIAIRAAKCRDTAIPHTLFDGPPGLGKTTLARTMANEIGSRLVVMSAPSLDEIGQLLSPIFNLGFQDILFIDEIHALPRQLSDCLLTILEDFRTDVSYDGIPFSVYLPQFTIIGATTEVGKLDGPLRDRFKIRETLGYYSPYELTTLLAQQPSSRCWPTLCLEELAKRSLGTPRIAISRFQMVEDYSIVTELPVSLGVLKGALDLAGIDSQGLSHNHRKYLDALTDKPQGIATLSGKTGIAQITLEAEVEPYLLRRGMMARTPRGRVRLCS